MASFGGLLLTNRGRNLQAKAQVGAKLIFTRMAIGDGNLNGASIIELKALINERKSMPISKLKVLSPGQSVIGSILKNDDITSGFFMREIGIFATDPDIGEILYCYGNAGPTADYIPAGSGGGTDVIERVLNITVLTGNAANVSAVIDESLIFETPEGAQEKADAVQKNLDLHMAKDNGEAHEITNIVGLETALQDAEKNAKNYTDTAPEVMLQNMGRFETSRSAKDANGNFLTVEKRRKNGTLFEKAVLSDPNAEGNPTVRTITTYAADGITVVGVPVIFDIQYDADGDYVKEVPR